MNLPRLFPATLTALFAALLVIPAFASAQATRTWVSGVGDDANPCSRTAPCKTFAGAISKTAVNGEINCLDPGGFGAVTITKGIRISCYHVQGSVLASGTNGIVINAPITENVVIDGLDINGNLTGLDGIRVLQAKSVKITRSTIFNFTRNAIHYLPLNTNSRLYVSDTKAYQNTINGLLSAPTATGTGRVTVTDSEFVNNGCGITVTDHLAEAAPDPMVRCGTQLAADGGVASAVVFDTTIDDSRNRGIFSNGAPFVRVGRSTITGSSTGVGGIDAGATGGVFSWGDNIVTINNSAGAFAGTLSKS